MEVHINFWYSFDVVLKILNGIVQTFVYCPLFLKGNRSGLWVKAIL